MGATVEDVVRTRLFVRNLQRDGEAISKAHGEVGGQLWQLGRCRRGGVRQACRQQPGSPCDGVASGSCQLVAWSAGNFGWTEC